MATNRDIVTIETKALGDRSYVIIDRDSGVAAVIDPQRDIDRIEAVLSGTGARITHVFETHIHNDYVTGGLELSRRTGAAYILSAEDDVAYASERTGARDGDEFPIGSLVLRAVRSPGVITRTCGSAICSRARRTFLVETNTSSTGDATPGGRNAGVESSSKR